MQLVAVTLLFTWKHKCSFFPASFPETFHKMCAAKHPHHQHERFCRLADASAQLALLLSVLPHSSLSVMALLPSQLPLLTLMCAGSRDGMTLILTALL